MSLTPLDAAYTNISNCFPAADAWTRLPKCLRRAESRTGQTLSFTSLFGVGGAEGANSFGFIVRSITRTNTSGDTAFDTNMIRFARETGQSDAFTRRLQASRAIRNCDLMSLAKCRSALDPNTWGGATPAAVLVHSHAFKEPSAVRHQLLVELLGNESVNLQSK